VARGEKIKFPVTPKVRQSGNFARLVAPQIAVVGVTLAALLFGLASWLLGREGYTAGGLVANGFWAANNIMAMGGMIFAAFWKPDETEDDLEGVPA
jgi:cellulose synthase (UDP-forming)